MPKGTIVTDTFARTVSNGWGSADTGQAWSTGGAGGTVQNSDFAVGSGVGTMSVPVAAAYRRAFLTTFSEADVDLSVTVTIPAMATGAPVEVGNLIARATDNNTYYLFRAQIETDGSVSLLIFNRSGHQLGSTAKVLNATGTVWHPSVGNTMTIHATAIGGWLAMRAWHVSDPEPLSWQVIAPDFGGYTGAGFVGVRAGLASGNTNTKPVVFSFDNFQSVKVVDFATDKVPLQVLAAWGADLTADWTTWTWTDISADVEQANGQKIVISPMGRSDQFSVAPPAQCTFGLKNLTGKYAAYNPASSNYPNVRRNTPIWVLVGPATRFFGYAVGFTPSWDASGRASLVSVTAAGDTRRFSQGSTPIASPALKGIQATKPVAYLPFEDPVGSTQIASAVTGRLPMPLRGTWSLAAESSLSGSMPLPTMTDTSLVQYPLPAAAFTTAWQIDWHMKLPQTTLPSPTAELALMQVFTSGTIARWDVVVGFDTGEYIAVHGYNVNGVLTVDTGHLVWISDWHNGWTHFHLTAHQNGSNIDWKLTTFPSLGGTAAIVGASSVAGTWGAPTLAVIPASPTLNGVGLGHLGAYNAYDFIQPGLPLFGYIGETADDRLARICDENDVPLTIIGDSTTQMGVQSTDTLVNDLRECETADQGVLLDGLNSGLTYITRTAKENLTAALTVDATKVQLGQPFAPVDDDQRTRNLYQVSRKGGSTATYADTDGPMGTDAIGTYDSSLTANLFSDTQLPNFAAWLVHVGTVQGYRYPTLNLNFKRTPALARDWLGALPQSRIDVTNVPAVAPQHPAGTVSLLLEGYTESISPYEWTVQANCSPYDPWNVATVGVNWRLEMAGQTLASSLAPGATSLSLATAAGHRLFTTTVMNTNPYFEGGIASWTTDGGGGTLASSGIQHHQGSLALRVTPDGTTAGTNAIAEEVPVFAAASYDAFAWLWSTASAQWGVGIAWYDTTHAFISTTKQTVTLSAATWTNVGGTFTSPAGAVYGRLLVEASGTPAATNLLYVDEAVMTGVSSRGTFPADFPLDLNVGGWQVHVTAAFGSSSPQPLTIDPAPNTTTIPSGTAVTLWKPAALAR